MRFLWSVLVVVAVGCGGASEQQRGEAATPEVAACTIDGQLADGCYAASKGGGAVFGLALTRGPSWMPGFVAFFFDASTRPRGASTFPAPNNDMTYSYGAKSCDGVGSATWADDGTNFCVTVVATCETNAPMTHIACVPSALLL